VNQHQQRCRLVATIRRFAPLILLMTGYDGVRSKPVNKRLLWFALVPALLFMGIAIAQYPMMDMVADRLVQKYQQSSCEQLWQERAAKQGRPKSEREQQAVQLMHDDPQMRAAFITRVAAPIANKMFECGMIP
jgi:hypothetical protein